MRRLLVALAAAVPLAGSAQEGTSAPSGVAATFSVAGGGELGLEQGKAGVFELEGSIGYDLAGLGLRPEIAGVLGVSPDTHLAIRPGFRVTLPGYPIQLRAALDASNSRPGGFEWRWLLVGAAAELRFTGQLGLYAEIDTGVKLSSRAGVPLLLRAGASIRF